MFPIEYILLGASVLLLLSVLSSKASGRLGVPGLLLFLLLGMLAGSDGPGGIHFDDPWVAQLLGVSALVVILFAGGIDTEWRSIRPVLWSGIALATAGVLLTAGLVAWFATVLLELSWAEGLLLGGIVSSTDAAAVFAVLRSRRIGLSGTLKPLLELEAGSNDPMAVFLTATLTSLLAGGAVSLGSAITAFVTQMILGAIYGYAMGRTAVFLLNRIELEHEGLYPALTMSLVVLTYSAATSARGNGFWAVYVAGLVMGNSDFIHKRSLVRFHDGLAWLMQIVMFLTLGLQVFPSRLPAIALPAVALAFFLMFVARPASVMLSLAFSRLSLAQRTMVAWVGLRGAVPIVLATFPLVARLPNAELFFNLVFFTVLGSAVLQGTSIPTVAKWLGVDVCLRPSPRYPLELEPTAGLNSQLAEVAIPPESVVAGKPIVEIGLPSGLLIVLIARKGEFLVPRGSTVIQAGDRLLVLSDPAAIAVMRTLLGGDSV